MDWFGTIITALTTGGLGATAGTIYAARKNAQVGMSGNEVEVAKATTADWTAFTTYMQSVVARQDQSIKELNDEIKRSREDNTSDEGYIYKLTNHINLGLGPPAPSRDSK